MLANVPARSSPEMKLRRKRRREERIVGEMKIEKPK